MSVRSVSLRVAVAGITAAALGAVAFAPAVTSVQPTAFSVAADQSTVDALSLPVISQQKLDELGADWTWTFLDTADGERLHTSIMVPKGTDMSASSTANLPVIAIVSPYLGYESINSYGPSDRFLDLLGGADVFNRGYAVIQTSTRGTGGSSGCLDILGPGEQLDTVTAVEWAASQPWSNGRVGMYGKSYDANTGVFAVANQPTGLEAVVAQAIAPDRYRGSYADRTRLLQSVAYPSVSYGSGGEATLSTQADPEYNINSVSHSADCQAMLAEHYVPEESLAFWRLRDSVDRVKANGSSVPTFVTAGYIDVATNIGAGATDFFNTLSGDGHHLWVGWWPHVRGNDVAGGRLAMGRAGFFDAVMGFYDENLKGIEGADTEVVVAAQTSDGTWREETSFPGAGAKDFRIELKSGTYTDDGQGKGSNDSSIGAGGAAAIGSAGGDTGIWSITPPLTEALHVAGLPRVDLTINALVPLTNIAVNLYDIAPDGKATFLSRGVGNVDATVMLDPSYTESIPMFATDWIVEAGHRIGVFVHDANTESFIHVPTGADVTVISGSMHLQALPPRTDNVLAGASNAALESFRTKAPFSASAQVADSKNTVTNFEAPRFS